MWQVGDYVVLKTNLVFGNKYGIITYSSYLEKFQRILFKIRKISNGNFYLGNVENPSDSPERTYFSKEMLICAKYRKGDLVYHPLTALYGNIQDIQYSFSANDFEYRIDSKWVLQDFITMVINSDKISVVDCEVNYLTDNCSTENFNIKQNENQLQTKDSHISRGEGVKGIRVYGKLCKASVSSRCIRNSKAIRGI